MLRATYVWYKKVIPNKTYRRRDEQGKALSYFFGSYFGVCLSPHGLVLANGCMCVCLCVSPHLTALSSLVAIQYTSRFRADDNAFLLPRALLDRYLLFRGRRLQQQILLLGSETHRDHNICMKQSILYYVLDVIGV